MRPQLGAWQHPAERQRSRVPAMRWACAWAPGGTVWLQSESGNLGASGDVWERCDGDVESEAVQALDVGADLPAGVAAVVVIHAQIFVSGARCGQQRVVDLQLGVAESDLGFGLAAAAGQPPVAG